MTTRRTTRPPREKPAPARREPAQARALRTRELIFEAALKLLEGEGLDAFTSNRLAEVSGFSVGTIYQYFSDKRAVLAALGERETERALTELQRGLAAQAARAEQAALAKQAQQPAQAPRGAIQSDADPEARIRVALRVALGAFGGRIKARRLLVQAALRSGRADVLDRPVDAMVALLQSPGIGLAGGQRLTLGPEQAFALAHAVMGAVRSALLREPALLKRAAFEDALVRLVAGFLFASDRLDNGPSETVAGAGTTPSIRRPLKRH